MEYVNVMRDIMVPHIHIHKHKKFILQTHIPVCAHRTHSQFVMHLT